MLRQLLTDQDMLEEYVKANALGPWHVCGTRKARSSNDRDAVLDPRSARVYGLHGLRVADAVTMLTAPRTILNIPTIMVAEKVADLVIKALAQLLCAYACGHRLLAAAFRGLAEP